MIGKGIAGVCIATVLAQMLICGVLFARGSMSLTGATQILGIMNGIDVSGDRVAEKIKAARDEPIPSFEEVRQERAKLSLEMDLRRRALENYDSHLQVIHERQQLTESRFDARKEAFYKKREELKKGEQDEAKRSQQSIIEGMTPAAGKDQLIMWLDGGDLDGVVAIVKAMQPDKRKKILREFKTADEAEKLHEILDRIGEGDPDLNPIDSAPATN